MSEQDAVYQCRCATCQELFNGHKRAVVCPTCQEKRLEGLGFPWLALLPPAIGVGLGIYFGVTL